MLIESSARLKYISIPPRKMRLVADAVKGMPVEKALNVLNFTPKIAAKHIANTLKSAAANALSIEGTDHVKPEDLVIKNIFVDVAPTQKRIRFQSMGRVFRYKKRFCHLTILLSGEVEDLAPPKASKAKAKTKAKAKEEDVKVKAKAAKKSAKKPAKKTVKKKSAKVAKSSGKKIVTKVTKAKKDS